MLKIPIERALERAKQCLPEGSEIIELRCLTDGQWSALYYKKGAPVLRKRVCYPMLECPLFDKDEFNKI